MGCKNSKADKSIRAVDYLLQMYPQTLAFLELSSYSYQLADMFTACDKNNSQNLSIGEFLTFCKVSRTRAAVRLFSIFDADGTGNLDFREIMVTVWHLCTLDHHGLEALVYDLYDENQDEELSVDDMSRLLEDCYGAESLKSNPNVVAVLTRLRKAGAMNREKFFKFVASAPQAMKQVIDMQKGVQLAVLGPSVWKKLLKRRRDRTDPAFRPENWQGLMERVIVLDLTARARAGAPDKDAIIVDKKKKKKGAYDDDDDEDILEEVGMGKKRKSGDGKKGKRKKKAKGSLPAPTGVDAIAQRAEQSFDVPPATETVVVDAAPEATGGYKVKDREDDKKAKERALKLKQREKQKRNELGNTGKPGVYESEEEGAQQAEGAEEGGKGKKKKKKGKKKSSTATAEAGGTTVDPPPEEELQGQGQADLPGSVQDEAAT